MEGNQSIEEYLENHRGRTTGDTNYFKGNSSNFGITPIELEDNAKKLKCYELIDVIIKKAKSLGIVTEENEEAYRQKLDEKSIKELEDFLESIKGLEDEQQDGSASINQQETKTTDEGREPGK